MTDVADDTEARLTELKCLRDEILQNQSLRQRVVILCVVSVPTLWGLALGKGNADWLLLGMLGLVAPSVILVCGSWAVFYFSSSNSFLSSYISAFLEPKVDGFQWETAARIFKTSRRQMRSRDVPQVIFVSMSVLLLVIAVCCGAAVRHMALWVGAVFACGATVVTIHYFRKSIRTVREEWQRVGRWRRLAPVIKATEDDEASKAALTHVKLERLLRAFGP